MKGLLRKDDGSIALAMAFTLVAASVAAIMLSWFLLSQAQGYYAARQQANQSAIDAAAAQAAQALDDGYTSAMFSGSPGLPDATASGSTATVTSLTPPSQTDGHVTATIRAVSLLASGQQGTISTTEEVTLVPSGGVAYLGADSGLSNRPVWLDGGCTSAQADNGTCQQYALGTWQVEVGTGQ